MRQPRPAPRDGCSVSVRALLAGIRAYQRFVSPLLGPRCRFAPTCSRYAAQALAEHGLARGGWLAARRLSRCHPFHPGGHDPVPVRSSSVPGRSGRSAPPARSATMVSGPSGPEAALPPSTRSRAGAPP